MDLKEQEALGTQASQHWYYVSKSRAVLRLVGSHEFETLLDIGAGSGTFARLLLDAGVAKRATCVDTGYADDQPASSPDGRISFVRSVDDHNAGLVLLMDVLEHVDDDVGLVRQYTEKQPPGTSVLATVPAFKALWSGHDDYLGHKRRYTLSQLREVMISAGLEVEASCYFFAAILPVAYASRVVASRLRGRREGAAGSQLRRHSAAMNRALILIHDLEARYLMSFNRVAGLTAMCLARRRG